MGHQNKKTGFTIVELLIVVVVIAILAAITIVAYNGIQQRARVSNLQNSLSSGSKALEVAKVQTGVYPDTLPSTIGSSDIKYEKSAITDNYCLTKASGSVNYFVTSKSKTPTPGTCAGLVAWWPLNNSVDDMINAYDGTSVGGSSSTGQTNVSNTAWAMVGDSTARYIATPLKFSPANFTTSIWAKSDGGGPSGYSSIMSTTRDCCSTYTGMHLQYTRASGNVAALLWNNSGGPVASVVRSNAMTTGQWQHFVVTYDNQIFRMYINGTEVGSAPYVPSSPIVQPVDASSLKLGGGGWTTAGYTFGGSLDDARVYNRALIADEVTEMYTQGAQ
jgi:prepilin-type N-terminal cleavage/methylation domain-containing protein